MSAHYYKPQCFPLIRVTQLVRMLMSVSLRGQLVPSRDNTFWIILKHPDVLNVWQRGRSWLRWPLRREITLQFGCRTSSLCQSWRCTITIIGQSEVYTVGEPMSSSFSNFPSLVRVMPGFLFCIIKGRLTLHSRQKEQPLVYINFSESPAD